MQQGENRERCHDRVFLSPEFDSGELGGEDILVDLGFATGGGFPLYAEGVLARGCGGYEPEDGG